MTEEEWIVCADPQQMLTFLYLGRKVSERKVRLFAVACYARIWQITGTNFPLRAMLRVAGEFAEGICGTPERAAACSDLQRYRQNSATSTNRALLHAVEVAGYLGARRARTAAEFVSREAVREVAARAGRNGTDEEDAQRAEMEVQAAVLCCLFGPLPFRKTSIEPTWLAWNESTIPRIAQTVYNDRAFDRLPILADALEEAGCADAALLGHCRGPGPHVRGCWVVDLLLGRT